MKQNLLKLALCAMALLPLGAWADESSVSTEKTWTFSGTTQYKAVTEISDGLYVRGSSGRSLTETALGSTERLTFTDGYVVDVNTSLLAANAPSGSAPTTAGGDGIVGTIAVNVNTKGTLYVKVKASNWPDGDASGARLILRVGSNSHTITPSDASTMYELKYDLSEAGVAYLDTKGSIYLNIYAIHFVPKTVLDNTKAMVYIGETGYASFGNNSGSHLALPAGLTAYKAKAADDGHSVVLTSVPGIRSAAGYIVKGTANTNYRFSATDSDPLGNSNTELQRVKIAIDNFAAQDGSNYRYILAADGGEAKFFAPDGTSTLAAGKAYLETTTQLSPAAGSRGINLEFEDGTTGIGKVAKAAVEDGKWYTLQGIEVKSPTKGVYIRNGKKVVVK